LPLPESFLVETLADEGIDPDTALLAARLAGGNLGRARRMARAGGLAFREAGVAARDVAAGGPAGALGGAQVVCVAAAEYRPRPRTIRTSTPGWSSSTRSCSSRGDPSG